MNKVSVGLTLYNEGKGVNRVLNFLDQNHYLINDVVIVSDACKDETDNLVEQWATQLRTFEVTFIKRSERAGRSDAIRLCIETAKKDLIILLAGDTQPFPDSLRNLIAHFEDKKVGAVTGHPFLLNGERTMADALSHLMWESHNNVGQHMTLRGGFFHLNGEMFGIRRQSLIGFENYNGLCEDAVIGYCVRNAGYVVKWAKDVLYYMQYPSSMKDWLKVRRRCCFGRVELARKYEIKDYPFYELSHSEYLVNIFKCSVKSFKRMLALPTGAMLEILCRTYYSIKYASLSSSHENLLKTLWESVGETKW